MLLAPLCIALASSAVAQDGSTPGAVKNGPVIEEIMVTAQRRSESIQNVPIAVTAFSGYDLETRGITSIEAIAARTPSFVFNGADAAEPYYFIRGIGTEAAQDAAAEPSIAIYVDDVYIGRGGGANFDLFDLERVEILRGPQGTLFGRNATGGVVHLVSRKPEDTFSGRVEATVGDFNRMNLRGMVTGPITDGVAYKLAGSWLNRDGFVENEQTGNDVQDQDATSARGSLLFDVSDDLQILLAADMVRERGLGTARDTVALPGADPRFNLSNPKERVINALEDGSRERDIFGLQARVDYAMNDMTLTSITAYRESEFDTRWSFSGQPELNDFTIESFNSNIEDASQFSQEFRLAGSGDRLDWVTGFFYFDMDTNRTESFDQWFNGLFLALLGAPLPIGNGVASFDQTATTESWAVFGQASYRIDDHWSITGGLRYTDEEKTLFNIATTSPDGAAPVGLNGPYQVDVAASWDAVNPHLSVDYRVDDDRLLYASVTNGFKSGAFAGTAPNAVEAQVPLEPEDVWNYEIGAKTEWLDRRLRVNAAAFYMDFTDLQIGTLIPGQAVVRENASAEIAGIELETLARFNENLTIGLNYSHLNSEFTDGPNEGRILPRSPDHRANMSVTYNFQVTPVIDARFMLDWTWQSEIFHEPDNRPSEVQDAYSWVDVGMQFNNSADTIRVNFWCRNLTDELVALHQVSVAAIGQNFVTFSEPRTLGVTATYSF